MIKARLNTNPCSLIVLVNTIPKDVIAIPKIYMLHLLNILAGFKKLT